MLFGIFLISDQLVFHRKSFVDMQMIHIPDLELEPMLRTCTRAIYHLYENDKETNFFERKNKEQ